LRVPRFDANTRILHWSHAIIFIWLLTTGIGIFITTKSLLGNPPEKMVHLYAALPFILLPPVIYILSGASTRNDVRELMSWSYGDLRWIVEFLRKKKTHVTGKFNGGQKLNLLVTLLLIIGLSLSGFVVWMKSMFSRGFVEFNFIAHDFFATLAILLLAGHIIFTLYYSESLRGIIYGEVEARWAKEHYSDWYSRVCEKYAAVKAAFSSTLLDPVLSRHKL
jgi:formate dehydrogenase subunit gamma